MLPYDIIEKAAAGEPEAVSTVIQHYIGYIKYLSYFQGSINDDIQDCLKAQLRGRKRINRLRPQFMMMCYAIGSDKTLCYAALQTRKQNI